MIEFNACVGIEGMSDGLTGWFVLRMLVIEIWCLGLGLVVSILKILNKYSKTSQFYTPPVKNNLYKSKGCPKLIINEVYWNDSSIIVIKVFMIIN